MRFANPAAWWLALLTVPVIVLHILRPRRTATVVSSTFLWRALERPVTSATPFKRLRPSWLLLLQLLAVVLAAGAVANPMRVEEAPLAPHTVFIVDTSGSMAALDGQPDRVADAVARARQLRDDLPTGGVASVISAGPVPQVKLSSSPDPGAFTDALATIEAQPGRADFAAAFALAAGLETADAPIGFVLLSDGGLTVEEQRLLPPGTTYERIGDDDTNRGIVALSATPNEDGSLHLTATVAHRGGPPATQTLRLDVDGRTVERAEIELRRGREVTVETDAPAGDRVEAFLEGEDLLAADNRRWAVTSRRQEVAIHLAGEQDAFVLALLQAIGGVDLVEDPTDADLVIYDRTPVPEGVSTPFLAIAPPGGAPGVQVAGVVEQPVVTLIAGDDPLVQGLDLDAVAIAQAQRVSSPTAEVLAGAEAAPLLLRGRAGTVPFLYLSFAVADSNLAVQVAFPILGDRILAELTGAALPPTDIEVGDPLPVGAPSTVTVTDPLGRITVVPPGTPAPRADQPGFWTVTAENRPTNAVAVNPAAAETELSPVPSLPTERRVLRPGESPPESRTSFRPLVIVVLLAALVLEFLLARRAVGVGRLQWRVSVALRAATAACLVVALLGVGVGRSADRVATVFVVDVSDSMGTSGRNAAFDWVREALTHQDGGALAGVVLFGGDARIEALLREELTLGQPAVQVDPSRTDLAGALRLGGAVLPDDARRRVVLLSDGRATQGDAAAEAARLAEAGVGVDVVLVDEVGGADVAVARVDVPSLVRVGEAVPIEVVLESSFAGPAVVNLTQGDQLVSSQEVALVVGRQTVRFTDTGAAGGSRRYEVEVLAAADTVDENDLGFAAVPVEGAASVLVVEGVEGEGSGLAAALEAGGILSTVVSAAGLPPLEELVSFSAIVLVDVDERQLTARQVGALNGAVRDAGRGLVTIGGDQSYGLGGYYTSDLEGLLPVVSEILDPKRRQTVAQVLAIDTSGSMGACHCAEGQFASNRADGGVNKTDISRAAAAATIGALSENDEVGVLAFNVADRWVIDLQKLPPQDVVNRGLQGLNPDGGTNPSTSLATAAEALRESNASLKHIILFTDGFTAPEILGQLAEDAADLAAEGITVSVVATGEGAATDLRDVADGGEGRFYPGRDLQQIPEIIMEEAIIASRDFVNEGSFLPVVTSSDPVVARLEAAPPLLGYVATSAKPAAQTLLRIGPDEDPLLATWQVGLGRATSWTSDASDRWSQLWADWDGYVDFWATVVKDTFPRATGDGVSAIVDDGILRIRVEPTDDVDADSAIARITSPGLASTEVALQRVDADAWVAEVPVTEPGTYVIGTSLVAADGSTVNGSVLTSQSYAREYRPGVPDGAALARLAEAAGGRTDLAPEQAFDALDLSAGERRTDLTRWFLWAAVALFPLAVILSRAALNRAAIDRTRIAQPRRRVATPATPDAATTTASPAPGPITPRPAATPRSHAAPPQRAAAQEEDAALLAELAAQDEGAATETVSKLLERARERRQRR
jgi:Mg-chelatase subunit ChlD